MLFWGKTWAWYLTAVMFVLNNTFIQVCDMLAIFGNVKHGFLTTTRACTYLFLRNISTL
jgi:hypothetical protein